MRSQTRARDLSLHFFTFIPKATRLLKSTSPLLIWALSMSTGFAQIQNQPDDGQWVMAPKNYASTRYSTLNQITTENAANLKLAWTFSTGAIRGEEAAPLVVNNTMYVVTPFPNLLYALDLTKPGAPMKWMYQPAIEPASQGEACCDVVNRGAAYYNGKIYLAGGANSNTEATTTWEYDPVANTWITALAPMPFSRNNTGSAGRRSEDCASRAAAQSRARHGVGGAAG